MRFLESNLEDIIYSQLKTEEGRVRLMERGLECSCESLSKRQLKIGSYGVLDIVTLYRPDNNENGFNYDESLQPLITVYELKQDEINVGTLIQAARYLKGIKLYLRQHRNINRYSYKITLIGKTINMNDWIYLFDVCELYNHVDIYEYNYNIDGLTFKKIHLQDYFLTNSGF